MKLHEHVQISVLYDIQALLTHERLDYLRSNTEGPSKFVVRQLLYRVYQDVHELRR